MHFLGVDWTRAFASGVSPVEIIVRGSVVYLALFAILRLVLKREAGTVGIPDLLMIVLIADASQNAMSASYRSVTDGLILVGTIVFWNYALDWAAFHFPRFRRLIEPPPLLLVRDGHLLRRNMRKELITEDELMSLLREQGIAHLGDVKEARIESDGRVSFVPREGAQNVNRPEHHRGV